MPKLYSPQFKDRAVWMVADRQRTEQSGNWTALVAVGVTPTGILWISRRWQDCAGRTPSCAGPMRSSRPPRRFSSQSSTGPHEMIRVIDEHRDRFGVELICHVLSEAEGGFITAWGCRAAKTRQPSARTLHDKLLIGEITRLRAVNYNVYGVRKMWHRIR